MIRHLQTALFFVLSCAAMAQDSAVVMRVAGKPVTAGELAYGYRQSLQRDNPPTSIQQYAERYVRFRLKVEAALDAGLDTTQAFRQDYHAWRDAQVRHLLVPRPQMERECRAYYERIVANMQGRDVILPAHIFIRLPQQATKEQEAAARARIDSVAQLLTQGKDFAQLAAEVSEDKATAHRGGELSWMGPNQALREFEEVAYALQKGEISQPFLSTVGFHIVRLADRKPLESYEELKPAIARYLESRGLATRLAEMAIDSIATYKGTGKSVEQILDEEATRLCNEDSVLKYQMQAHRHSLLAYAITDSLVWRPVCSDTLALETYFKKHKKAYAWKKPHFHGMIYYCRNKKDVKAVKKAVKRLPPNAWEEKIDRLFNADSIVVKMEAGQFVQGDNRNIDILALKTRKGVPTAHEGFPYVGVVGDKLKKGPKEWTDVASEVVADCQAQREDELIEQLRKKYPVETDEAAVKQIHAKQ